ncbi:DUF5615 family PIN-like protein [Tychonema sp. LEGE 07203]|uniref:DUF5615 family PIN-like protein n=1 Tax=Tychonema sp. LEGE 07203 TaxID=1828671 RepID=UPI00187E7EE7|nr:DUF5615 family PIN-like protein [Tychonema sp. LEGE 07203]MBE9096491.1 DUF5615 family PIN-like protein [Tychonema sp. LEGE 07203]
MARIYADEHFPRQAVQNLRSLGHDVLTVQEAGNAGLPDEDVLAFAISENRVVLTVNRRDFFQLHKLEPKRCGIFSCTRDDDIARLTANINDAISIAQILTGKVIRVYRSGPPSIS